MQTERGLVAPIIRHADRLNISQISDEIMTITENAHAVGDEYAHVVGQLLPNAFGLFDMHGNVWELCEDWYDKDYYMDSPSVDPTGPNWGSSRIARGGSWFDDAANCRSAYRNAALTSYTDHSLGFRLAR